MDKVLLDFLRITPEKYQEMRYEYGCRFIEHYLNGDAALVQYIISAQSYWDWWNNQWKIRDEMLWARIRFAQENFVSVSARDGKGLRCYEAVHNPETLAQRPPRHVMHQSYKLMAKQVYRLHELEKLFNHQKRVA